jgi:DNA-binding NtrC family response regulator
MSGSHLALVADEPRLARALEASLHKALGQPVLVCAFDAIREYLGPDTDGVLVLAAASPADLKQIVRLAQELSLKKWPATLFVLAAKPAALPDDLARLEGYAAQILGWPADTSLLARLVKERCTSGSAFSVPKQRSIEEVVHRSFSCWTPSLLPLCDRLILASMHDVPVLLTGETGTGKSHLARLIHQCSPRKNRGFLVVPCGALVASLFESELFGHCEGAFSGAERARDGKFAAAGSGTLLLDEIEALGLEKQAKLLRVLDTGEFEPVGSNESQLCKARVIVASNWNLEEAVANGKLRHDLYYRLNVLSFQLAPLRERVSDIEPLARGMAARYNTKFQKDLFEICPDALASLEAFPWPGNIRQLEHAVQQAVLVSSGPVLSLEHLPAPVRGYIPETGEPAKDSGTPPVPDRDHAEQKMIQQALEKCGFNRARAAAFLGISRTAFYQKLRKYGMIGSSPPTPPALP